MKIDRTRLRNLIEDDDALALLQEAAGESPAYLVGGSVRDALLDQSGLDLDVAIDGPVAELALRLDEEAVLHERFDTAEIVLLGRTVDLARCRSERYRRPGALPSVEPAPIEIDLARRDFTINAIAAPLAEPGELLDPCGGLADLERRVINVIHARSFEDDPTRALRAARYAARLGFDIDHRTADLIPKVDLDTVSADRIRSELELLAIEPTALEGIRLARAWDLITLSEDDLGLAARAFELMETGGWSTFGDRPAVLVAVLEGSRAQAVEELMEIPGSPSLGVALAGRRDRLALLLARAAGAEWLERWKTEWREVKSEVTGEDLLEAGIPRGEAVGAGLAAALAAALDEGVTGHEGQMAVALAAARAALPQGEA